MTTEKTNQYKISSIGHLIGGVLIILSVFLTAMTILGVSVSFIGHPNGSGIGIFFIVLGAIIIAVGLLKKRWLHILSLFLGLIVALLGMKYQADCKDFNSEVGIGLWFMFFGGLITFLSAIIGFFKK